MCVLSAQEAPKVEEIPVSKGQIVVEECGVSAALMTSDRGTTGKAEMKQLDNSLVPPKAAGLNPNAHVFQSKGVTTPTSAAGEGGGGGGLEWQLTPEPSPAEEGAESPPAGTSVSTVSDPGASPTPSEPVFGLINGDEGVGTKMTSGITFPPSPESPINYNGYENTNGMIATEPFEPSDGLLFSDDQLPIGEGPEYEDQLREMLKTQLEYYFSRENLANDTYLVSQMDADQYVPISTVANFNQVKRLTADMDLVIEVLRESGNVQVDEKGEKVRPLHKRCVVILREIPESTPVGDVERLFSGENCPKFVSCEFAHNNNWYVTFNSDEDAQRAYQYLREEVKTFQGKPIMARIKAKPLVHSTFLPKNGFKQQFSTGGSSGTSTPQVVTSESNQVFNQQRFSPFNQVASAQYIISQQGYPFFPPNTVVQAPWPPAASPMTFFDPGTAFTVNGYTPAATFKLSGTSSRHGFQNNRNRNPKVHRGGSNVQDREHPGRDHGGREHRGSSSEHRGERGRDWNDHYEPHHHHNASGSTRLSPRVSGGPSAHEGGSSRRHDGYHSNQDSRHHATPTTSSHSHSATASAACSSAMTVTARPHGSSSSDHGTTNGTASASLSTATSTTAAVASSRQISDSKDSLPRKNYRSRRRGLQDIDGAKNMRQGGAASKDPKTAESPKFELEATSFPPLPGATPGASTTKTSGASTEASGSIWENKMSDVVKGTVKPSTKPATVMSSSSSSSSNTPASSTATTTVATATASQTNSISSTGPAPPASKTESKDSTSTKDKDATKEKESIAKEEAVVKDAVTKEAKKVVSVSTATSPSTTVAQSLVCSLPTPPQSPLKVSKWTSTETVVNSKPAPPTTTSTTTQTTLSQPSTQVSCSSVGSQASVSTATTTSSSSNSAAAASVVSTASASASKLSYAQMVAKSREAAAQREEAEKQQEQQQAVTNGPASKPTALRDQSQVSSRPTSSKMTSSQDFVRKEHRSDDSARPVNGRRAKENRDRRGPPMEKERFRERRRGSDRDDLRPAYASK